ncbi:MAG TPA: PP2C family serine/threonine-protein phosphatase [Chloroflexia bacterium]|jgi:protein phosphatase
MKRLVVHPPPQLAVEVGLDEGMSRQGTVNQDCIGIYSDYCEDPDCLAAKGLLFVLADGMGGALGGEVASRTAVDIVGKTYYDDPDLEVALSLERALRVANTHIHELGQTNAALYGLGTTLVAAVILGDNLIVANVGDSRAYQFRQGELILLTLDHTVVQEQVRKGVLSETEAITHPRRHELSRNLGAQSWTHPDIISNPLLKGDTLLLCSDGLWGAVGHEEIEQLLRNHRGRVTVQMLIDLANQQGGPDNISVILIYFGGLEAAITEPVREQSVLVTGEAEALVSAMSEDRTQLLRLPAAIKARFRQGRHWQVGGMVAVVALFMLVALSWTNMFLAAKSGVVTSSRSLGLEAARSTPVGYPPELTPTSIGTSLPVQLIESPMYMPTVTPIPASRTKSPHLARFSWREYP